MENGCGPSRLPAVWPPAPSPLQLRTPTTGSTESSTTNGRLSGRPFASGRRPTPLNLSAGLPTGPGMDEELHDQRTADGTIFSPIVIVTDSGDESDAIAGRGNDLFNPQSAQPRSNLHPRPAATPFVTSPLHTSSSFASSSGQSLSVNRGKTISLDKALSLLRSSKQPLVIDVRSLGYFLESHLPRSVNLSIPTLIFKRLRKGTGTKLGWDTLGSFISTQAGKDVWASLDTAETVNVVIVGDGPRHPEQDICAVLKETMAGLVGADNVHTLEGGFDAILASSEAKAVLVCGEDSRPLEPTTSHTPASSDNGHSSLASDSRLKGDSALHAAPSIPSTNLPANRKLSRQASVPALRRGIAAKRNLPSLQVHTGTSHKQPQLGVVQSAMLGAFPKSGGPALKTALSGSFQALCLAQSQREPGLNAAGSQQPETIQPTDALRPGHAHGHAPGHGRYSALGERSTSDGSSTTATTTSARDGSGPFIVSTILPNFLYLGPEITSADEVQALKDLGIERILNVAVECNDDAGLDLRGRFDRYVRLPLRDIIEESGMTKGMRDACDFLDDARLHSSPTYVHCRAGKSRSVTVVLAYLIHANAWSLATAYAYVAERRKGISPNIGFVAELMQFEEAELGLKQSGGVHGESSNSYGSARRSQQAEHATEGAGHRLPTSDDRRSDTRRPSGRHARESLPPQWAQSLDSRAPRAAVPLGSSGGSAADGEREQARASSSQDGHDGNAGARSTMGDHREVRKNGHWVHQRRAPVDRTTLQPGRRVSKAGLESLTTLSNMP